MEPVADPTRTDIDALPGPVMIEFGASRCGYCRAAQPLLAQARAQYPRVRHIQIEDHARCRLGRSFGIKLWPALVFLRDGKEIARLVRPADAAAIVQALALIDTAS